MMHGWRHRLLFPALLVLTLGGCSMMPDWFGEEEEVPLAGERISLGRFQRTLIADEALRDEDILAPVMPVNAAWPQAHGNVTGVSGNLAMQSAPHVAESASVGDGNAFTSTLIPAPILAGSLIFAIDGHGVISAHDINAIDTKVWSSTALQPQEDDEDALIGGGLGYSQGMVFAVGNEGVVAALNAQTGELLWRRELLLPLRSPPRITPYAVLVLTADNQLLALDRNNGELQWSHQGINEITLPLHSTVPALRDGVIVTSYSSGELVALDHEKGAPLWSDTLLVNESGDSSRAFRHISPVMATGLTIASSSESIGAFETATGRRLWDREVGVKDVPWLSGNTLFFITPDDQLVAMRGIDGGIHWVKPLPQPVDEPVLWHGPVVADGALWVVGSNGTLFKLSVKDGSGLDTIDIPDGVMTAPIIANQQMYLISADGRLHSLR